MFNLRELDCKFAELFHNTSELAIEKVASRFWCLLKNTKPAKNKLKIKISRGSVLKSRFITDRL